MFFSTTPPHEYHESIHQALPALYVLRLDEPVLSTREGMRPAVKSEDVYFDQKGWVLPATGQSYFEIGFEMQRKWEHPYLLTLHFTKDLPETAKFTIYVNGQLVEFPSSEEARRLSFDIRGMLREYGDNTIRITNNASSAPVSFSGITVGVSLNPFEKIR